MFPKYGPPKMLFEFSINMYSQLLIQKTATQGTSDRLAAAAACTPFSATKFSEHNTALMSVILLCLNKQRSLDIGWGEKAQVVSIGLYVPYGKRHTRVQACFESCQFERVAT